MGTPVCFSVRMGKERLRLDLSLHFYFFKFLKHEIFQAYKKSIDDEITKTCVSTSQLQK